MRFYVAHRATPCHAHLAAAALPRICRQGCWRCSGLHDGRSAMVCEGLACQMLHACISTEALLSNAVKDEELRRSYQCQKHHCGQRCSVGSSNGLVEVMKLTCSPRPAVVGLALAVARSAGGAHAAAALHSAAAATSRWRQQASGAAAAWLHAPPAAPWQRQRLLAATLQLPAAQADAVQPSWP